MPVSGYFDTPFAEDGSLTPVPDAPQGNGSVSYNQGFGVLYSTPVAQGGLNIPRAQTNQIFNDITTAVQNWQQNTIAPFITTAMNGGSAYSYPEYALVLYEGVAYQSNTGSNTDTPPSSKWNVANVGSGNTFIGGTTTGSANAQVLASLTPSGFALDDGYSIRFTAGYTNTTATTLAITSPSISATAVYKNTSTGLTALTGGEIVAGNEVLFTYNAISGYFILTNPATGIGAAPGAITGFLISGLTGTNTTASATITAGSASDSLNKTYISGGSFSWAASNGNAINGTDASSSTLADSTTYNLFVCFGTSGVGTFCSASLTPTFPNGYNSYHRRIGCFNTTAAGAPIPLNTQVEIGGGAVINYLTTQTLDINVSNQGTSRVTYTLNVPTGIKVQPLYRVNAGGGSNGGIIFTSGDETDVAPGSSSGGTWTELPGFDMAYNNTGTGNVQSASAVLTTNTSGQIGARGTTTSMDLNWVTRGWIDFRRN